MAFAVAVTRPEPQAGDTARRLRTAGYDVVMAPLSTAVPLGSAGEPDGIGTLALTSRTAARLLAGSAAFHGIPVAAVGEGTAAEAERAGFRAVASADGNVGDLLVLLEGAAEPIVHMTGEDHRGALVERLLATGRRAERRVLYRMAPAAALPAVARLDAALLYSPRAAEVFCRLATAEPWRSVRAVALSPAVAAPLRGRPVAIAEHPDEESLVDALAALRDGATVP